jgi:hypothetical protein
MGSRAPLAPLSWAPLPRRSARAARRGAWAAAARADGGGAAADDNAAAAPAAAPHARPVRARHDSPLPSARSASDAPACLHTASRRAAQQRTPFFAQKAQALKSARSRDPNHRCRVLCVCAAQAASLRAAPPRVSPLRRAAGAALLAAALALGGAGAARAGTVADARSDVAPPTAPQISFSTSAAAPDAAGAWHAAASAACARACNARAAR